MKGAEVVAWTNALVVASSLAQCCHVVYDNHVALKKKFDQPFTLGVHVHGISFFFYQMTLGGRLAVGTVERYISMHNLSIVFELLCV